MAQNLSAADVRAALAEIGEILLRDGKVGEIALYRGSAILLQFEASFRTADVDAVVRSGDHTAILDAARAVAARRGWLRSWFSEAVANYLAESPATTFHGSYPSETRPGLRVYVARPDYLLAMKLRAMRAGTRDEADAAMLARACGMATAAQLVRLVQTFFPKEAAWRVVALPWFVGRMGVGLSELFLVESPVAFRRRGIFTEAVPLRRARMPPPPEA